MNRPIFDPTRRRFLRQACCAAVGSTGMLSTLAQLRVLGAVAADSPVVRTAALGSDYKALVCLFLSGGNDGTNMIIPSDAGSYAAYAKARSLLAVNQSALLPFTPRKYSDGRSYGFHPSLPGVQRLFGEGKIAVLANVGTLVQPTTLSGYRSGQALPPQLFAHNEQSTQWQSSVPDRPFQTGWGGRLADLMNAFNSNNQVSMSITLAFQNSFQVGNTVGQYSVSPNGVSTLSGSGATVQFANSEARISAVKDLMANSNANLLGAAFAGIHGSAIRDGDVLGGLLPTAPVLRTAFPGSSIGAQLRMVAKLISLSSALNLKRQIFFCQLGGFDTHAAQVGSHGTLLAEMSGAMAAFHDATVEMGVANQVTTFTASDFGRTYTANAEGSDHGWGNHQLIMGGAVQGGDIYGAMPSLALGGPDDTGQGRWLPGTSVDEYSATLATWFGVSAADLPVVLPNIGRFAKPNLGFMA
ncbi:MAG: DUF1501 domain-containing protein [Opitutaceae bacterium]|nr:DUF1501 domain-containing protein [Opitutaceae bacterium]